MVAVLGVRNVLLQSLSFTSALASSFMAYKGAGLLLNVESPAVVVLSGSMEPAFYRGDLIFLTNPADQKYQTGDIVVYDVPGNEVPIVHRILETRDVVALTAEESEQLRAPEQLLLTKGDNNEVDDLQLYNGLEWLERQHIKGKVCGYVPYVGYATIAMNDFPQIKYALFGILGVLALVHGG